MNQGNENSKQARPDRGTPLLQDLFTPPTTPHEKRYNPISSSNPSFTPFTPTPAAPVSRFERMNLSRLDTSVTPSTGTASPAQSAAPGSARSYAAAAAAAKQAPAASDGDTERSTVSADHARSPSMTTSAERRQDERDTRDYGHSASPAATSSSARAFAPFHPREESKGHPVVPVHHLPISPPSTDPRQANAFSCSSTFDPFRPAASTFATFDQNQQQQQQQQQQGQEGGLSKSRPRYFNSNTWSPSSSSSNVVRGSTPAHISSAFADDHARQGNATPLRSHSFRHEGLRSPVLGPSHQDQLSLSLISHLNLHDASDTLQSMYRGIRAESSAGGDQPLPFTPSASAFHSAKQQRYATSREAESTRTVQGDSSSSELCEGVSRYLLVEGISTEDLDVNEMVATFKKYGELRGIYARDLFSHHRVVLSFYDLRGTSEAFRLIQNDRNPVFRYQTLSCKFVSRSELLEFAGHSFNSKVLSMGEGSLVVKATGTSPLALRAYFQSFGEIRVLKRNGKLSSDASAFYDLEYFDDRCAAKAFVQVAQSPGLGIEVDWQDIESLNQHILSRRNSDEDKQSAPLTRDSRANCAQHSSFTTSPISSGSNATHSFTPFETSRSASPTEQMHDRPRARGESKDRQMPDGFTSGAGSTRNSSPSSGNARHLPPLPNPSAHLHLGGSVVPNDTRYGSGGSNHWGLLRDDPTPDNNLIRFDRIISGQDKRTSCILRNLPNRMTQLELMENLDEICPREYDFIYLRFDFQSGSNCGFGFVNFITLDALLRFWEARLGTMWDKENSRKLVMGGYANIQGKKALMERFRNSSVMDQDVAYQPKIFYSEGPLKGLPEPFPPANNMLRKARSAHATGLFGLYGSKPKGGFRPVQL